jgi:hypothetical protein
MATERTVMPDYHRRAYQTLRDRKRLAKAATDLPLMPVEHQKRQLRTEYVGGIIIGLIFGAGGTWLLNLWVNVGGCAP